MALLGRELHGRHHVVLVLGDPELARMLREAADVRYALSVPMLAAPAFVASLFGDRVLSVFQVRGRLFAVIDLLIQAGDPFVEHSVRAMSVDYRLQAVALFTAAGPPRPPPLAARLRSGDRLVGIIALPDLEHLLRRQQPLAVFAVEVLGFPLPARDWLAALFRTQRRCTDEEASLALKQLPLCLAEH